LDEVHVRHFFPPLFASIRVHSRLPSVVVSEK
jgi:hypothetical protein